MKTLELHGPYPSRKAAQSLREQLVRHLLASRPPVGQQFYSDAELMDLSGLGRKAVRRALDDLQREGWIYRVPGRGSFVGPRVATAAAPLAAGVGAGLLRLAVLAQDIFAQAGIDWYSAGILHGLDHAAAELSLAVELLGGKTLDPAVLSRRLAQSRPDALVVMANSLKHAIMIGEARRVGMPCILIGTQMLELELPSLCEDGAQGIALAVRHLAQQGHRRIGLALNAAPWTWVFQRRKGYLKALAEAGLEADGGLIAWVDEDSVDAAVETLRTYLRQRRPTALILASVWPHARAIGRLMQTGELRIPEDLSLVCFGQALTDYDQFLGMRPTMIELPLEEIGRRAGMLARELVARKPVAPVTCLSCRLAEGKSVSTCPQ